MINATNIVHYYQKDIALNGISLEIKKGEFVAIIGESGSGKSTLLSILSTLLTPSEGELSFDGVAYKNIEDIDSFRKRNIGFIFQFHYLIEYLSLRENIRIAKPKASDTEIEKLLSLLGIEKYADKLPNEISGGERQRGAIARALINSPKVLFADEPTGNLDSKNADLVFELFKKLSEDGTTIIVTTHNKALANKADRIIEVKDGTV
jgi:putative ABC transport system ATP-binding protein